MGFTFSSGQHGLTRVSCSESKFSARPSLLLYVVEHNVFHWHFCKLWPNRVQTSRYNRICSPKPEVHLEPQLIVLFHAAVTESHCMKPSKSFDPILKKHCRHCFACKSESLSFDYKPVWKQIQISLEVEIFFLYFQNSAAMMLFVQLLCFLFFFLKWIVPL